MRDSTLFKNRNPSPRHSPLRGEGSFRARLESTATCSAERVLRLHAQEALGVAAEYFDLVLVTERHVFHPPGRGRIGDEGIVNRKQNTVDAHLLHAAHQRRRREIATGGNVEMVAERIAKAHRLLPRPRQGAVDAPNEERERLAEMAENDLQTRMGLEDAAQHQADRL